jgi:hypothetical protein
MKIEFDSENINEVQAITDMMVKLYNDLNATTDSPSILKAMYICSTTKIEEKNEI